MDGSLRIQGNCSATNMLRPETSLKGHLDRLKTDFSLLKTAPPYDYEVQVSIVLVCSILHNFILEHSNHSDDEETVVNEISHPDEIDGLQSNLDTDVLKGIEGSSALPTQVLWAYTR